MRQDPKQVNNAIELVGYLAFGLVALVVALIYDFTLLIPAVVVAYGLGRFFATRSG